MAKSSKSYSCQSCGAVYSKWSGKCEACGEWNSLVENVVEGSVPKGLNMSKKGQVMPFQSLKREEKEPIPRHMTGMAEFDRVTGGGLVPGSAILIGGDPGIGKSTLLLQSVCALAARGVHCVYISGEEAVDQVRLRAERLGLADSRVQLASATNVRDIMTSLEAENKEGQAVQLVVIDSIQTMYIDNVESAPGTVTQVRTAAQELTRMAKKNGICILFVGHVTKEGQIAGPRVLEHMVDAVLYFEGDRSHQFRILRAVKNRFGATDEIGVFEMAREGLVEISNPSALFLAQRQQNVPGSAVLAGLEGTRPLLVEIQALVAPSHLATPRRTVIGWDHNRLAMILAVLESRCGLQFSGCDIFLNVAGGVRITEPAADLAVCAALISSLTDKIIDPQVVFFGEVGLAGEIRQVAQADLRLKEAAKMGFEVAYMPALKKRKGEGKSKAKDILKTEVLKTLQDLIDSFPQTTHSHDLQQISNA